MREQVITPRAGRAAGGSKGRGAAAVQRPNARRGRAGAQNEPRQQGFAWKSALPYVPALLKGFLAVALGLLVYLGYRTAVSTSFFKVRTVDVAGATRSSREEIRAAVVRLSNAGAWQADLEVIAKELKGLPWVRDAVVTRVLPAGLRVRVTEREPRAIARTAGGKLVWVDDEGVALGTATPGDEDFFVRGLEEGGGESARRGNRQRMEVALGLMGDWDRSGLSQRVSELDLSDLRDVRVHLAGEDSGIQVVLGEEEYVKRFRQALAKLGERGRMHNGECVSSIRMTTGRNAIFAYNPCAAGAEAPAASAAAPPPESPREAAPARAEAGSNARRASAPAAAPRAANARSQSPAAARARRDAKGPAAPAVRPRRAEVGRADQ